MNTHDTIAQTCLEVQVFSGGSWKGQILLLCCFFLLKAEQVNHFSFNHHLHTQWAQCQTLRKKTPKYVTLNLYAVVLPVHLKKLRVQTKQNQWQTKKTHTHTSTLYVTCTLWWTYWKLYISQLAWEHTGVPQGEVEGEGGLGASA